MLTHKDLDLDISPWRYRLRFLDLPRNGLKLLKEGELRLGPDHQKSVSFTEKAEHSIHSLLKQSKSTKYEFTVRTTSHETTHYPGGESENLRTRI